MQVQASFDVAVGRSPMITDPVPHRRPMTPLGAAPHRGGRPAPGNTALPSVPRQRRPSAMEASGQGASAAGTPWRSSMPAVVTRPPAPLWPERRLARWLLRVGVATPLFVLSLLAVSVRGVGAANQDLIDRAALISPGSADLSWVGHIWPPIPAGAAFVTGSGALGIAAVGAFVMGCAVVAIAEMLVLAAQPWWSVAVVVAAIGMAPTAMIADSSGLTQWITVALLVMATASTVQFVIADRTERVFHAGLALGVAVACSAVAIISAVALATVGAGLVRWRTRRHSGATSAAAVVLAFPAAAAVGCWAFLEWRFTGETFAVLGGSGIGTFPSGVGPALAGAIHLVGVALLYSPLFIVSVALLALRSWYAASALAVAPGVMIVAVTLGFQITLTALVVMLASVAAVAVAGGASLAPHARHGRPCPLSHSRALAVVMVCAAVLQVTATITMMMPLR